MPSTADHRVAMHTLASTRRAQGLPMWQYTVPRFGDIIATYNADEPDENALRIMRDQLVAAIKNSRWYAVEAADEYSALWQAVDELSNVADPYIFSPSEDPDYDPDHHFNSVLHNLYDLADYARCWLAPAGSN